MSAKSIFDNKLNSAVKNVIGEFIRPAHNWNDGIMEYWNTGSFLDRIEKIILITGSLFRARPGIQCFIGWDHPGCRIKSGMTFKNRCVLRGRGVARGSFFDD